MDQNNIIILDEEAPDEPLSAETLAWMTEECGLPADPRVYFEGRFARRYAHGMGAYAAILPEVCPKERLPPEENRGAICGGHCCKAMPGSALPEDFGEPIHLALFRGLAQSGLWAVDWWEGDIEDGGDLDRCYYWRATRAESEQIFDPAWGGTCSWLTETGCREPFAGRPSGCRSLRCVAAGRDWKQCKTDTPHNDKAIAARAWRPYYNLFETLRTELNDPASDEVGLLRREA